MTDRHSQVAAFMAQEKPAIKHAYDVWHLAKGNVSVKCKPVPPLANIEIQKNAGEKKRLQKIVKTKNFEH